MVHCLLFATLNHILMIVVLPNFSACTVVHHCTSSASPFYIKKKFMYFMYFYVKIPGTDITGHVNDDASFSIMSNISFLWHIECAAECIYSIYFTVNK